MSHISCWWLRLDPQLNGNELINEFSSDFVPRRGERSGRRDLNPQPQPWQGYALPLSYFRQRGTNEKIRRLFQQFPGAGKLAICNYMKQRPVHDWAMSVIPMDGAGDRINRLRGDPYAILGDDVLITDGNVASHYREILSKLGVQISDSYRVRSRLMSNDGKGCATVYGRLGRVDPSNPGPSPWNSVPSDLPPLPADSVPSVPSIASDVEVEQPIQAPVDDTVEPYNKPHGYWAIRRIIMDYFQSDMDRPVNIVGSSSW
ncbi:unnamed protein product [Cuscuta campestris]|uniref:Uncharacterized protein n=1 Tax=Cuscuta campestris TaxID=132261 RepID=A0A484MQ57_9ASTE|nr:unnamed protein product [Cuscuta campestris]